MISTELFASGRPHQRDRVGLELELFPVVAGSGSREIVHVRNNDAGENSNAGPSIIALLEEFSRARGCEYSVADSDAINVRLPNGGLITLEPAGQIEYSGPPMENPVDALNDLRGVVAELTAIGAGMGIEFLACGYNAAIPDEAMELQIRKPRYLAMDRHFASIGPYGRRMMRGTCALQINLDFGSEQIAAERWRLANMIAPSLNALFANSPHYHEGRSYRSFRYEIWRHADPSRTGRLYDRPDLDPVADYLRFALDAAVMLIPDGDGNYMVPDPPMTFRDWLRGSPQHGFPGWEDWNIHLTTLFPDVRARGWMELRAIDSLPCEFQDIPVAMATTLLYNDDLRRAALERLEYRRRRRDSTSHEHDGFWYADHHTGVELLELAIPGLADSALSAAAQEYYERYASRGITPGDQPTFSFPPIVNRQS